MLAHERISKNYGTVLVMETEVLKGDVVKEADCRILDGDAVLVLGQLPDACADLVVTSPPYADRRGKQYGGPPPDAYADWFLPIAGELLRVLKPTGSFVLNIKENVVDGERNPAYTELARRRVADVQAQPRLPLVVMDEGPSAPDPALFDFAP